MAELIRCPQCGVEIEVAQALSDGVAAKLRKEILADAEARELLVSERETRLEKEKADLKATVATKVAEERSKLEEAATARATEAAAAEVAVLAEELEKSKADLSAARKERAELKRRERELDERTAAVDAAIEERVDAERAAIREAAREQALKEANAQATRDKEALGELRLQVEEQESKLGAAREKERALLKQKRELDQKAAELDVVVERRLTDGAAKIREEARAATLESQRIKDKEKDEQIDSMRRKIDELKQKAEQGSQQLQGEAQELVLEDVLRTAFPLDHVEPVPKGVHGGDVIQRVLDPGGTECGAILWESKRTRNWSDGWLPKLRGDLGAAKAARAILVSAVLPKGCTGFGFIDGVWVTDWASALGVATAVRLELAEVARARRSAEGQQGKMELLYKYLSGVEFRHRVAGIAESFVTLKEDLDAERRQTLRLWAKREKQLERAIMSSSGLYGDLQGIIGKSLPAIAALETPVLAAGSDEPDGEAEPELPGSAGQGGTEGLLARVLRYLQDHPGPHSKGDLLAGARVSDSGWPVVASALAADPRVARTGEKRGTRYTWIGSAAAR